MQAGQALEKAALINAGSARLVYVFVAPLAPGGNPNDINSYQTGSTNAGQSTVVLPDGATSVQYSVARTASNTPIQNGTYRVAVCINQNNNNVACDSGDLVGVALNVAFSGGTQPNVNVELTLKQ